MKSPDVNKVAALIAEVAATEIQPRFRKLAAHEQREKGPGDIVTIADEGAEAAMTPRLMELLPGSIVIGEEAAAKDPKLVERLLHDQVAWIVDPVDGTANFAEGKEEFVSMVALVRGDELIGSWIHLPMTGHTAIAERGAGATYDGVRLPKLSPQYGGAVRRRRRRQVQRAVVASAGGGTARTGEAGQIAAMRRPRLSPPGARRARFHPVRPGLALGSCAGRSAGGGGGRRRRPWRRLALSAEPALHQGGRANRAQPAGLAANSRPAETGALNQGRRHP